MVQKVSFRGIKYMLVHHCICFHHFKVSTHCQVNIHQLKIPQKLLCTAANTFTKYKLHTYDVMKTSLTGNLYCKKCIFN